MSEHWQLSSVVQLKKQPDLSFQKTFSSKIMSCEKIYKRKRQLDYK